MAGYRRGSVTLTAVLLESRRIDGQPRQKYVARLGTLCVWANQDPGEYTRVDGGFAHSGAVIQFWHGLIERLDGLEPEGRYALYRVPAEREEQVSGTSSATEPSR